MTLVFSCDRLTHGGAQAAQYGSRLVVVPVVQHAAQHEHIPGGWVRRRQGGSIEEVATSKLNPLEQVPSLLPPFLRAGECETRVKVPARHDIAAGIGDAGVAAWIRLTSI